MAFLIFLICAVSYALGMLNIPALVSRYLLGGELEGSGYMRVLKQFRRKGVLCVLAVELIRCLLIVLLGGLLLKGRGFTSVGQFLAVFFAMLGQALPAAEKMQSRSGMVMAGFLLLFADWRIFLVCLIVAAALFFWQKRYAAAALGAAILYPIMQLIFHAGGPIFVLSLLSSAALVYIYRAGILRFIRGLRSSMAGTNEDEAADAQTDENAGESDTAAEETYEPDETDAERFEDNTDSDEADGEEY